MNRIKKKSIQFFYFKIGWKRKYPNPIFWSKTQNMRTIAPTPGSNRQTIGISIIRKLLFITQTKNWWCHGDCQWQFVTSKIIIISLIIIIINYLRISILEILYVTYSGRRLFLWNFCCLTMRPEKAFFVKSIKKAISINESVCGLGHWLLRWLIFGWANQFLLKFG